jgi:hypothetical protein
VKTIVFAAAKTPKHVISLPFCIFFEARLPTIRFAS